jgi:hypothetical protein
VFASRRATFIVLVSAALLALAYLPASAAAIGADTRTWVSGVGDDANPCSRTAPCKTLAGAYAQTAQDGEIDSLDAGGFGALTIQQGIKIDLGPTTGGVLVSGINGIVVDAPGKDVVLRPGPRYARGHRGRVALNDRRGCHRRRGRVRGRYRLDGQRHGLQQPRRATD